MQVSHPAFIAVVKALSSDGVYDPVSDEFPHAELRAGLGEEIGRVLSRDASYVVLGSDLEFCNGDESQQDFVMSQFLNEDFKPHDLRGTTDFQTVNGYGNIQVIGALDGRVGIAFSAGGSEGSSAGNYWLLPRP